MSYAAERGVPWGISESAFNARDLEQTYQYSSFGVPGLGLKRGLSEDVVVAPYATALGAMIQPEAAVRNFARLRAAGARRALRLPRGARLHGAPAPRGGVGRDREELHGPSPGDGARGPRQRPQRPRDGGALPRRPDRRGDGAAAPGADAARRARGPAAGRGGEERRRRARPRAAGAPSLHLAPRRDPADAAAVERAVRGHGDGRGLRLQPLGRRRGDALARGRDPRRVGQLPLPARHAQRRGLVGGPPAERGRGGQLRGHLLGGPRRVLPSRRLDHDAPDRRRVGGARRGDPPRVADQPRLARSRDRADVVRRDRPRAAGGRRRPPGLPEPVRPDRVRPRDRRPPGDPPAAIAATSRRSGPRTSRRSRRSRGGVIQYETDRARFLGRGRSVRSPVSVIDGRPLSNTVGAVLDPIFSLGCRVQARPRRDRPRDLLHRRRRVARGGPRPGRQVPRVGRRSNARRPWPGRRPRSSSTTSASSPTRRISSSAWPTGSSTRIRRCGRRRALLARNERGAPALWAHGISGDLPIVLVRIDEAEDLDIVRQLLRAHEYWRLKLLDVDLVILNEHGATYAQDLHDALETLVRTSQSTLAHEGHPGRRRGVHPARRPALQRGPHAPPGGCPGRPARAAGAVSPTRSSAWSGPRRIVPPRGAVQADDDRRARRPLPRPELEFFNGLGGFADGGREYVTVLGPGQSTPAPWVNVIANAVVRVPGLRVRVGLHLVREQPREPAHRVVERSRQRPGERGDLHPRRRQRRAVGSDGPADPLRGLDVRRPPRRRATAASSTCTTASRSTCVQFVPLDDPVKISRADDREPIRARQAPVGDRLRRVGAGHLARGQRPADRHDAGRRRPGRSSRATPGTPSSAAGSPSSTSAGGRRRGRPTGPSSSAATARPDRPAGLDRGHRLQGASAPAWIRAPPCRPASSSPTGRGPRSLVLLGEADDAAAAVDLVRRGAGGRPRGDAPRRGDATGTTTQGTVQVRTPDRSMDIMLNRWLLYQTLACRLWARTAFYQAGGAYGFRDQLQDVIALAARRGASSPGSTSCGRRRASSSRETSSTGGIRRRAAACGRRISDDRLWLPYAVDRYLEVTGDAAVLDETGALPRGTAAPAGPGGRLLPAGTLTRSRPRCSTTAPRRSTGASPSARTACRSSGRATGTTA